VLFVGRLGLWIWWRNATECLGAQNLAYKHERSHLIPQANSRHLIAPIGGTDVTSTLTGATIRPLMSIDCLYVQRWLLSVCLRRRRKKLCKSALYIYRGNALSGSLRSIDAEVTRAHTPHIAYRTHSNTLQTAAASRYDGTLLGADPRPRSWLLICGN
jgi:hypothetical protein